ncbi:hypothetical protein D3C84_1131500 [compost metagenome]
MLQREKVARSTDGQRLPRPYLLVHGPGAATGTWVLEHADQVAMAFPGIVAQGVLAGEALGYVNVDVGTGFERRQRAAVRGT